MPRFGGGGVRVNTPPIRRPGSPGFGGNTNSGFPNNSQPGTPKMPSDNGVGGWGWNNGTGGWGTGVWKPDILPQPNSGFTPIPAPPPQKPPGRIPPIPAPVNPAMPSIPDVVNNAVRRAIEDTFNPPPDPVVQDLIDENRRIVEEFNNPELQQRAREREQHQNRFNELMGRPGNEFGVSSVGRWIIFQGSKEWRNIERWGNTNQPNIDQTQLFDSPVKKYYIPAGWELITKSTGEIREDWYQGLGFTNWGVFITLYMKSPSGVEILLDPPGEFEYLTNYGGIVSTQWWGYPGSEFSESNNSVRVNTFRIEFETPYPVPIANPFPLLRNPTTEDEEMPCERCRAEEVIWMLRSMRQNVPVNQTSITRLPTGELLTVDSVGTKTVFCLPGTQQAIKDQFDLLAEIKKRTAHAFNQAKRAKMMTRILQIMNITDFFLNIHNAMMLSADIADTFFGSIFFVIDNIPKILDDIPLVGSFFEADEWQGLDTKKLIVEKIDSLGKQAFGVEKWSDAKAKWAAFNQIVRTGNTMLLNMKDLRDTQGDLAEMAAERIGKVNNALIKAGVLDENGNWMTENVSRRSAFLDKLEQIENSGVVNTAVFFQSMAAGVLDVQETKKELNESRDEFKKAIADGVTKLTGDATTTKNDSQGAASTNDDAKPKE